MPGDDERVSVQTYVPRYQREIWTEEAAERDMSRAEYIRTMVQAGRRDLGVAEEAAETGSSSVDPGGEALEERVLDVLASEGPLDWEALRQAVFGDQEERLEAALDELQRANRVRYSGPSGGYRVIDDGE
jgi:hypothetical protein